MLIFYVHLRAKKDLRCVWIGVFALSTHELANHGHFQLAYQVCHKDEAVLHDTHNMHGFAAKIVGNLPAHLLDALSDLLRRKQHACVCSLDGGHVPASGVIPISSIRIASPAWTAYA